MIQAQGNTLGQSQVLSQMSMVQNQGQQESEQEIEDMKMSQLIASQDFVQSFFQVCMSVDGNNLIFSHANEMFLRSVSTLKWVHKA